MNAGAPRGVAYLSLGGAGRRRRLDDARHDHAGRPRRRGFWPARIARRADGAHRYEAGCRTAMQRYLGGNAEALAAMRDGSRNVGALYAYDNWTIDAAAAASATAREYARYDYLRSRPAQPARRASPCSRSTRDSLTLRATVVAPRDGARRRGVPAAVDRPVAAAGAHVLARLARRRSGPSGSITSRSRPSASWPATSSSACARSGSASTIRSSRCSASAVGDAPASIGHYHVGSAGDFDARGWGVSVSRDGERRRARLGRLHAGRRRLARPARRRRRAGAASPRRCCARDERIHDVTASVESVVAPTATRFFVVYKLNTAFAAADGDAAPCARRAVRRAGQSGAAVPELHERALGDAGRRQQPVPRRARSTARSTTSCWSCGRRSACSAA